MSRSFTTLLFVAAVASVVHAQPGRRQAANLDPISKTLDVNNDQKLSASEISNASIALLELDADSDGTIDTVEIRNAMQGAFGGGQTRSGSRPGSEGSSTLERTGLEIGQKVPDIVIHDDKGRPFSMASLKGKYTVITFGCLT